MSLFLSANSAEKIVPEFLVWSEHVLQLTTRVLAGTGGGMLLRIRYVWMADLVNVS